MAEAPDFAEIFGNNHPLRKPVPDVPLDGKPVVEGGHCTNCQDGTILIRCDPKRCPIMWNDHQMRWIEIPHSHLCRLCKRIAMHAPQVILF